MDKFDRICIETIKEFRVEYGEKKFKEIEKKILNAKSVEKLMIKLEETERGISSGLVLAAVSSINFFMFSNKRYTAMGCLIFIIIWNQTINTNHRIYSDERMVKILEECFEKAKDMLW